MKRFCAAVLILVLFSGCGKKNSELDDAIRFRDGLLNGKECTFNAEITANYGDEIHSFSMEVSSDEKGDAAFCVTEPEVISGIMGTIRQSGAELTFDETILAFPMLAEGQLAPVIAPWIFIKALRSGYISSVGMDGDLIRLSLLDSYEDESLMLDVWFDEEWKPVRGEILFKDKKILTLLLENFTIV